MKLCFSFASAVQYWRLAHLHGMPHPRPTRASSLMTASARAHDLASVDLTDTGLDGKPFHLLVEKADKKRRVRGMVCHTCSRPLPDGSFFTLGNGIFVASPELLFLQKAATSSLVDLIEYGFELCGSYSLLPRWSSMLAADPMTAENLTMPDIFETTPVGLRPLTMPSLPETAISDIKRAAAKGITNHEPLTDTGKLAAYLDKMGSSNGSGRARRALAWIVDGSASPMETALAMLLCLPPRHGGYGLLLPEMNHSIDITTDIARVGGKGYYSCDIYWKQHDLAVEYESNICHSGQSHKIADDMRRNGLEHLGTSVISASNVQVMHARETEKLAHQIAAKMNRRLRKPTEEHVRRRVELRRQLLDFKRAR